MLIPPIIYGTTWKKEQTAELVEQAISQGFRGIREFNCTSGAIFQVSLKNLQTAYLNGLVLHSPLANQQELMEVWHANQSNGRGFGDDGF